MQTKHIWLSKKFYGAFAAGAGLLLAGVVQAAVIDVSAHLGAGAVDTLSYTNDITFDGIVNAFPNGITIGKQGTGGVTFFNGSIVNSTVDSETGEGLPVTFGDDVRIDGEIFRGPGAGNDANDLPLRIHDDLQVSGNATITDNLTIGHTTLSPETLANTDVAETLTTDWINTTYPWAADEIANVARNIQFPLTSFYNVDETNFGAIGVASLLTQPVFNVTTEGNAMIQWTNADTDSIGTQFVVPSDYASGGALKVMTELAATPSEDNDLIAKIWNIQDGSNAATKTFTAMTGGTNFDDGHIGATMALVEFALPEGVTLTSGDHVSFSLERSGGSDTVTLQSVEFEYTAVQ